MKYLSHIKSPSLAPWSSSSLLIIWFLIHITCLQGKHAQSGKPGISGPTAIIFLIVNHYVGILYISAYWELSSCKESPLHPLSSEIPIRSQFLSQTLIPPGICHHVKPSRDQSPNYAALWMNDPDEITNILCGWAIGSHLKDKQSIELKGQTSELEKPVLKPWLYNLLALLFSLWFSIFSLTQCRECLCYELSVLKV